MAVKTDEDQMDELFETVSYAGTKDEIRPWQELPDLATSDDEPDDPDPVPSRRKATHLADWDETAHPRGEDGKFVGDGGSLNEDAVRAMGHALDKLMTHFGADWVAVLERLHRKGALKDLLAGNVDFDALKKHPEMAGVIKGHDDPVNLPDIRDVSFPTMIGAIDPAKRKKTRRRPVTYRGVRLSRQPTPFEIRTLSLTEIPPRLDAAVEALRSGTPLTTVVQSIADFGSQEVCRELVRQGVDARILNAPPVVDITECVVRLEHDRAEEDAAARLAVERRLNRTRLRADARARVQAYLLDRRAPTVTKWQAVRAVNQAFALGRRTAIAAFQRPDAVSLAKGPYRDENGKFISKIEAVNSGIVAVDAVVQTAIMDTNTCDECAAVDGEVMELGDDRQQELHPPYIKCLGDDRCRCVQIAVLEDGSEVNVDEIDEDTLSDYEDDDGN